jgi:NADPH2:quinone reductase
MRAVVIARPGGPEVLELRDVARPEPAGGEVRVQVRAFGINRADLLQRRGLYPAPAGAPQDIPGLEFAGAIDAVGPDSPDRLPAVPPSRPVEGPGSRVMGIVGGGAYAEYAVVPAGHVLPIPPGMTFAEAAAIPEAFLTAFDALERLGVTADEWVIVHAVGSGVGTAAVQLIRARGARSIGTSRTPAKLERARGLGCDHGLDALTGDFAAEVRRITGGGAHAALDLVGGPLLPTTLAALRERGRHVLVGLTGGARAEVDLSVILRRRLRIEGTVLRTRSRAEKAALTAAFREAVLPLFARGALRPVLDRTMPFERVADAHAYMESNASFGKIVVEVP